MQLSVREAARLLNVSESTVSKWIQRDQLQAHEVNGQYRLNRAELIEYAIFQGICVSGEIFSEPDHPAPTPGLADALQAGGIYDHVPGNDKVSVLSAVVELMPVPDEVERPFLLQLLLARESLGSTGVGNGVAMPHARNPIVMHIPHPMVTLCFLEQAIEFDAVDGLPVHTLFAIVSPTVKSHLHILSRVAFALRNPAFAEAIARHAPPDEILAIAKALDNQVPLPGGGGPR